MGADTFRQAVIDRGDLDVALEDAEGPLDVGQTFVAIHDLRGAVVLDIAAAPNAAAGLRRRALRRC